MTEPAAPSTGYLDELYAATGRRAELASPPSSPYRGAEDGLVAAVTASVERRRAALLALSHRVHDHPETRHEEHRAAAAVAELLRAEGHAAEVGAFGLPTAVRATVGTGAPRLAILAEYDALPEIGHACGHNIICAGAVGAWLAVADHAASLGGTVELIGTPAEEGGGGKELIAQAGGFDGVDAALMLHPFSYDVATHAFLGRRVVDVVFHGVAAHAAVMPFMGRNALDAAVAAYTGIAALRQHLPSTDRVHATFTDGGGRPNVVPRRAALQCYVRSAHPSTLIDLSARLDDVFAAAALGTGTGVEVTWDPVPPYLPIRHNRALAAHWSRHLTGRGRTVLPDGVVPDTLTGSTDLGNLSLRLPAIHPMLAVAPPEVSLHTEDFAAWARGERGDTGVIDGAVGLAATAADYLSDAELRAAVREEFEADGGVVDVPAIFRR
ncbi:M20 family metallopeptidase [Pseudonocardia acaciae]|uniref:M20 family metallopeptidase n=1 Tax=Pseudonocardia acaciae TaxID=551276 RepID=UPI0004907D8F|nr:M20 family metallopeptidase [Pseudonocardia acaciae]